MRYHASRCKTDEGPPSVIFANAIYALCAFQKKSTIGVATNRRKLALIERRLNEARKHYAETYNKN